MTPMTVQVSSREGAAHRDIKNLRRRLRRRVTSLPDDTLPDLSPRECLQHIFAGWGLVTEGGDHFAHVEYCLHHEATDTWVFISIDTLADNLVEDWEEQPEFLTWAQMDVQTRREHLEAALSSAVVHVGIGAFYEGLSRKPTKHSKGAGHSQAQVARVLYDSTLPGNDIEVFRLQMGEHDNFIDTVNLIEQIEERPDSETQVLRVHYIPGLQPVHPVEAPITDMVVEVRTWEETTQQPNAWQPGVPIAREGLGRALMFVDNDIYNQAVSLDRDRPYWNWSDWRIVTPDGYVVYEADIASHVM